MQVEEDSNQENIAGRLEHQQPPRGIVLSEGSQWRAAHRRPFCAQYENGMFTVRDSWVIGPVRQNKAVAISDKEALLAALRAGHENALFACLRGLHHSDQPCPDQSFLYSFEMEVEQTGDGIRKSRAVCRGNDPSQSRRVTLQGPWQSSRIKAERDLARMKSVWLSRGYAAVAVDILDRRRSRRANLFELDLFDLSSCMIEQIHLLLRRDLRYVGPLADQSMGRALEALSISRIHR